MQKILHIFSSLILTVSMLMSALPVGGDSTALAAADEETVKADAIQAFDPGGSNSPNAVKYYDGSIQYSNIVNCISIIQAMPYNEYGMGAYVGFSADPQAAQPGVGQKYYIHIVVAGLGNSCAGQRAWLEFMLPSSDTNLAISPATPVNCFFDGVAIPAGECPQSLPISSYHPGAYAIPSVDAAHAHTWPVPQGHFLEIQIPVISSSTLTNRQLVGYVWALDGNSSPWLQPTEGVYIFSNFPSVLYPGPSTQPQGSPVSGYVSTTWVYNHNLSGNVYFDLGTSEAYGDFTDGPVAIPIPNEPLSNAYSAWSDWTPHTLLPNTIYHWRARFVTASQTYFGVDQTFTTAANGQVKMGSGSAASCTPSALSAALLTPGIKTLTFECGALPVTLSLSGGWAVQSDFTMDGGNKVSLQGDKTFRLFDVLNGGILTLKNIDLSGGATNMCGGGIHVSAGGNLNATNVRLTNNLPVTQLF